MLAINNASELMEIQPTIVRFTHMLSAVLKVDAEVVDANLIRVAGTGPYSQHLGNRLETDSHIFNYIIENKKEKIITESHSDPLCHGCISHSERAEKAFVGVPIIIEERCIGVISLVAFNEQSKQRIKQNSGLFSDYIKHIAQLLVANVLERSKQPHGLEEVFINLIDNMDQGVLVMNEDNSVKYGNQPALKNLNLTRKDLAKIKINIRPLSNSKNKMDNKQHIISLDNREELIVGQFHNSHAHKLFLMSFFQPYHSAITYETNTVLSEVIGESTSMRHIKSLMTRIASSPSSVLINGESGTGKEVIANIIHKLSNRSQKPFIAINCAAIPEQLLESELFGYTKGAFTGASSKGRQGLIQAANEGTLFLDEIGDMSMQLQAKLLRVLESREVMPIGSNKAIPVDIRIISATNRNFSELITSNAFREDLFYRLNVIPLHLSPLRERQGDVDLLVTHFIGLHTQKLGVSYPGITDEVMDCLNQYAWPGNVRELSNLVEYLINIVPEGEKITLDLLPPNFQTVKSTAPASISNHAALSLEDMERLKIEDAIKRLSSRQAVADELGIGIATLYRKIKKYGLND